MANWKFCMLTSNITITILLIPVIAVSIYQSAVAQDLGNEVKTFEDQVLGISFQYSSDWQIVSEEYTQSLGESNTDTPMIILVPTSFSGASFTVMSENLNFPMSSYRYYQQNEQSLLLDSSIDICPIAPTSIGNSNGYSYNVTSTDIYTGDKSVQTQIVFTSGSKGYVIAYSLGSADQSKDMEAIDMMLNSLKIEEQIQQSHDLDIPYTQLAADITNNLLRSLLPPISNSFTDNETGFKMTFPQGWTGARLNVLVMDGAVVSPNGSDISADLVKVMSEEVNQEVFKGNPYEPTEQANISQENVNKVLANYLPIISVLSIDRDNIHLFDIDNAVNDSYSSFIELFQKINGIVSDCTVLKVNYTILNTLPAERSISECVFDYAPYKIRSLVYALASNDNLILIEYSSKLDEFDIYYEEIMESFNTIVLQNAIDPLSLQDSIIK